MNRLESAYGRLFGAGARRGQLDLGFGLVVTGLLLAMAGLALFLIGEAQSASHLLWREAAIVVAAGGAPLVLLGIAWALPGGWLTRGASIVGAATCIVMAAVFSWHYPYNFNIGADAPVVDHAPVDVAIYLGGAALLVTAILTEIVSMYVRRRETVGGEDRDWTDTEYDVPDWVVERDIEEAMRMHDVSWEKAVELPGLRVNVPDQFDEAVRISGASGKRVRLEAPELESASQALRGIRDESVSVGATETGHATDALRALRTDMAQHPKQYRTRQSRWQRFLAWLQRVAVRLHLMHPPARRGREERLRARGRGHGNGPDEP